MYRSGLLFFLTVASAHFLRDGKNETVANQVCLYNGTWFGESDELPTRGLCLICHCFAGFVEPNAFSCNVIDCPWDHYHKRFPGCTPIYADRDCCPIGWECDYGTQNPSGSKSGCECEWRYLKHYEAKGCRPVYQEKAKGDCACPWRFDCSQADQLHADDSVCMYGGHVYPVGSHIPTPNPCEQCSCVTDYLTQSATLRCTTTECPSVYSRTPLAPGCHYVYKKNKCCPESIHCPAAQKDNNYEVPMCEYQEKMFYKGEQIYPEEDPCLVCICDEGWNGSVNSSSCRQHDCMLEKEGRRLRQGCIPIYHEKTCCPIDYHCADGDIDFKSNRSPSFKSDDDEDEMCAFEGRHYPIGHVLDIPYPTHCVTCTCKTPPDFTCIHAACPPAPDYGRCKAVYKPQACCPDYTCEEKTDDFENAKNELQNSKDSDSNDALQKLIQECKEISCGVDERCMLVKQKCDSEPCLPVAQCEKVSFGCGQKACADDCQEIGSYEGDCPICYCKEQLQKPQYELTCRVQSCEENCILIGRDDGGCPICQCPQGNLEERACAPAQCGGFNCTLSVNALGCAECRCQLSCKPRECPVGCEMDLDDPDNAGLQCGCQCANSITAMDYVLSRSISENCSPVSCKGLNCTVSEDRTGCPSCQCKVPCPVPVCQKGCELEKDIEHLGRCPGCVCKLSRSARDSNVAGKDCPAPSCFGYNCSVITGKEGCQVCLCESPCEEAPKCPSHCKLEVNVPEGRCRGCVCSYGEDPAHKPSRGGGKVPDTPSDELMSERREDLDADFIPLPGKDLVPEVDHLYLNHPAFHYAGLGEPLESALYHDDVESRLPEEAREELDSETHDYDDFAEEKTLPDDEEGKCAQKNCPEGQKCVIRRLQCIRTPCPTIPVCIDVEPRCPIPMCAIGCMVMKWDDEVCPSCFCGIIRGAEGRVCPRTRCMGKRCYNVIGDDGCPQCKCDSICIPPKCYDGCHVEKDPPAGKCPVCTCPAVRQPIIPVSPTAEAYAGSHKQPSSQDEPYQCPTPHCNGYNCSLIRGHDGCQKCVCDSPCAPCPPNCVKTKTSSEGRCPVCDCTVAPSLASSEPQCPEVNCRGSNCRTVKNSNGCSTCICDPKCAEPQCDPGCEILRDVPPGQCPGCVCKVTVVQAVVQKSKTCPPVSCSKSCNKTKGPDGCTQCICGITRACATPKCDPGCQLQTNVAAGHCPACVCPTFMDDVTASVEPVLHLQNPHEPDQDSIKTVHQFPLQQQNPVTFSSNLDEEEEETLSTLHTTVTVDLESDETTKCPPPICSGLRCSMETTENGCEVCKCKYKCPNPKCVGNCYPETNAPQHRCPGCVCPKAPKY